MKIIETKQQNYRRVAFMRWEPTGNETVCFTIEDGINVYGPYDYLSDAVNRVNSLIAGNRFANNMPSF